MHRCNSYKTATISIVSFVCTRFEYVCSCHTQRCSRSEPHAPKNKFHHSNQYDWNFANRTAMIAIESRWKWCAHELNIGEKKLTKWPYDVFTLQYMRSDFLKHNAHSCAHVCRMVFAVACVSPQSNCLRDDVCQCRCVRGPRCACECAARESVAIEWHWTDKQRWLHFTTFGWRTNSHTFNATDSHVSICKRMELLGRIAWHVFNGFAIWRIPLLQPPPLLPCSNKNATLHAFEMLLKNRPNNLLPLYLTMTFQYVSPKSAPSQLFGRSETPLHLTATNVTISLRKY